MSTHKTSIHIFSYLILALFLCALALEGSGIVQSAYTLIRDEGVSLTRQSIINFVGAGVTATNGPGNVTTVTIPGGSGSGYSIIQNQGTPLPQQTTLNFTGTGVTCADNITRTNCTINSGSGSNVSYGPVANLPSIASNGDLYYTSDSPYTFVFSSLWRAFYQGNPVTPPPLTGWSWDNQGTSTVNTNNGFVALNVASLASGFRVYYRTAPTAPYTITVRILKLNGNGTDTLSVSDGQGICFRDSTGKLIVFYALTQVANAGFVVEKWNSPISFNGGYAYLTSTTPGLPNWLSGMSPNLYLQFSDNGTSLSFSWSIDGYNWNLLTVQPRTDFFVPTQVGIVGRTSFDGALIDLVDWTIN